MRHLCLLQEPRAANQIRPEWLRLSGPKWAERDPGTQRGCSLAGSKVKDQGTRPRWLRRRSWRRAAAQVPHLLKEAESEAHLCPAPWRRCGAFGGAPSTSFLLNRKSKQEVVPWSKGPGPNIVVLLLSQHFCHRHRCHSNLVFTSVSPQQQNATGGDMPGHLTGQRRDLTLLTVSVLKP